MQLKIFLVAYPCPMHLMMFSSDEWHHVRMNTCSFSTREALHSPMYKTPLIRVLTATGDWSGVLKATSVNTWVLINHVYAYLLSSMSQCLDLLIGYTETKLYNVGWTSECAYFSLIYRLSWNIFGEIIIIDRHHTHYRRQWLISYLGFSIQFIQGLATLALHFETKVPLYLYLWESCLWLSESDIIASKSFQQCCLYTYSKV